jgi:hypothetical protein
MYRIHFDPAIGKFVIQIAGFLCTWHTVHREIDGPGTPVREKLTYDRYVDAQAYCEQIGLNVLYEDRSADKYRMHMRA